MSLFYFLISLNHAYGMISSKAITSDRPKNPDTQSEQFLPLIPLIPASPRMPWQKHLKQPSSPRSEPETMTCLPTLLGTHLPSSPLSPRMPWQNALVRSKFKKSESGQDPLFQTNSDSLDDLDTLLGFIKVFTNTTKDWVGKVSLMETPKFNKKNAQILEKTIDNYYQDLMNKTSWLMSDPPDLDIVNLEYKLNIHSIKMLKPIHYIEKLFIKKMARKKIYFFGSINGDTDTLLKILHALFLKKIITNDFHLSDLNHYLVF